MLKDYKKIIFYIFTLFIFFIVIPLFLWMLFLIILAPTISEKQKKTAKLYKDYKFQTGDLLFFSGSSIVERGIKTIQGGYFSHVCLIIKDRLNQSYILEVDSHPKKSKDGVHLMPLKQKLELSKRNRNKGKNIYIGYKKFSGDSSAFPSFEETQKFVQEYQHYKRDLVFFSWFISSYPFLSRYSRPENYVFCSELLIIFLEKYNIVKLLHPANWYSPQNLLDGSAIVYNKFYDWKPVELIEY